MSINTQQIEEFLDKLASDDDFRDRLVNDTASVLEEMGLEYDPQDLVDPAQVQLPSPSEVNENREAYREALFPDEGIGWFAPWFKLPSASE